MINALRAPIALSLLAGTALGAGAIQTVIAIDAHDPSDTLDSLTVGGSTFKVLNTNVPEQAPTADLWSMVFTTTATPATADQVLVIGSASGFEAVAREGITTFAPDAALTFFTQRPRLNDAGQWALGFTPQNLGAADPADLDARIVVATPSGSGYTFTTIAQLFDTIPDGELGAFADATIDNDGEIAFFDTDFFSFASNRATDAYVLNVGPTAVPGVLTGDVAGAEAETVPAGQNPPSPTRPLESVDDFAINANGTSYILEGNLEDDSSVDLNGDGSIDFVFEAPFSSANGSVMIVDGVVVTQEGVILDPAATGFTSPVSSEDNPVMNGRGDYAFEIDNADGTNAALLRIRTEPSIRVIALEGDIVAPGETDRWTSITKILIDDEGNHVVVGATDGPGSRNTVAVYNSARVLVREGEAVDVDGDGSIDGFVNLINDRAILSNDGVHFYAALRLRSLAGLTDNAFRIGENNASLFRVAVSRTAPISNRADLVLEGGIGELNVFDILSFFDLFAAGAAEADFVADGVRDVFDIIDFFNEFGRGFGF